VLVAAAGETLDDQAALIRFVWQSAPLLSLAHDVGIAGLEAALAEAGAWSGAEADAAGEAPPGAVVLGCAAADVERLGWPDLRVLGAVR
jgi:hypothetical protein